ncbi:MAG: serine hydrolase [Pseudomonadota bacterium]|nr:serine hydrolase [Pseudomonadota bacterium]
MNIRSHIGNAGIVAALVAAAPAVAQQADGYWRGSLDLNGTSLTIGVALERAADGALVGTLDSPDQKAFDIPLSEVVADADTLSFSVPGIGAAYSGTWDAEAEAWQGVFSQAGMQFPLTLSAGQPTERTAEAKPPSLPDDWEMPDDDAIRTAITDRLAGRPGAEMIVGTVEAANARTISSDEASVNARTLFEIGSMTKVFTGLLLADMVLDGTVSLDDPVESYLPDGATMPRRDGRQITLRNLSQQDSGLPRLPDNLSPSDVTDPYADYTEADLLGFLAAYELPREIGSQYGYSNLGVGLLGYVLARAAKSDFETLLRTRILDPLGMEDTAIALTPDQQARFIGGFDEYMRPTSAWNLAVLAGAGGLRSTAHDMDIFLKAALDPESAIAPAMKLTLGETRQWPGFKAGLGWMITMAPAGEVIGHGGGTGGFRSYMGLQSATGRGVVALTNSAAEPSAQDIALHVLIGAPIAEAKAVPEAPTGVDRTEVELSQEQLDRVTGTYRFNPDLALVVTRKGDQLMAAITGQGALPIFPRSETEFFWRAVNAEIVFAKDNGIVTGATFTQDGASSPLVKE